MGAIYLMNDIGMKDHCSSPKVGTAAFKLRKIGDSVHDEDKYKEYIDELYADVFSNLEQLAKSGGHDAEIPKNNFWDKLKAINPMISAFTFHRVEDKVLTLLSNNGFILEDDFGDYYIRW